MFTKNIFKDKDTVADLVGNILEADYKVKKEELKGNQHKIDMNKNNKIDAHDFKLLRSKGTQKEEVELDEVESVAEGSDHDNDYHYTDEKGNKYRYGASGYVGVVNKNGINQGQQHISSLSDVHKKNYEKLYGKKTKNEEVELDEEHLLVAKSELKKHKDWMDSEGYDTKTKPLPVNHPKHKTHVQIEPNSPIEHSYHLDGYAVKEEVEQIDELKKSTLMRYASKATKSAIGMGVKAARARDEDDMATWAKNRNKAERRDRNVQKAIAKMRSEEGLDEMDKTQTPPGRDGDIDWTKKQIHLGPERMMKAKDVAKHALKALDKTMKKSTPKKKGVTEEVEQVDERTLTPGETSEKERIVKGMKKSLSGFKQRYGDRAKSVMYATATKAAKKD